MDRIRRDSPGVLLSGLATVEGAGLAVGPSMDGYLWKRGSIVPHS